MNEQEFYNFVEETKRLVLSAIRRYLPGDYYHSIDDIAQETYLRAYKGLKKINFDSPKSLNNWLYTIAKNETFRMTEKLKKEEIKARKTMESIPEEYDNIQRIFDEEIIELKEIISTLPEKYKSIFELLVLGFSEKQISEKLSVKKGTIKSRIHRGKEIICRTAKEKAAVL